MKRASTSNHKDAEFINPYDLLTLADNSPFGLILINGEQTEYVNQKIFDFVEKTYTNDFSRIELIEFVYPEDRIRLKKLVDAVYNKKTTRNIHQITLRGVNFNKKNRFYNAFITSSSSKNNRRIQIAVIDISDEVEREKLQNQLAFESLNSKHKSDVLCDIKKKLDALINEKKYNREEFDAIFKALNPFSDKEIEWGIFSSHFEGLHPNFITDLQLLFPSLTINDIKHCACIRLNFSTKETANFFNVTPTSIQTSRVRLKKKLNIDEHVDLREFILNL